MPNYYEVLGVDSDASQAQIEAAYKQKVREHGENRHAGKSDEIKAEHAAIMSQVTEAKSVLYDRYSRDEYDAHLRAVAANQLPKPIILKDKPGPQMEKQEETKEEKEKEKTQQAKQSAEAVAQELDQAEASGDTAKTLTQTAQMMPEAAKNLPGAIAKTARGIVNVPGRVIEKAGSAASVVAKGARVVKEGAKRKLTEIKEASAERSKAKKAKKAKTEEDANLPLSPAASTLVLDAAAERNKQEAGNATTRVDEHREDTQTQPGGLSSDETQTHFISRSSGS